jgi:hypothetical protein
MEVSWGYSGIYTVSSGPEKEPCKNNIVGDGVETQEIKKNGPPKKPAF